ncbi:MAG TPA: hypothetical protein VG367_18810 [Mucilaginibacter sp.]|nr:hypothetical protein [Mucilaginibacter sp.]
MDAPLFIFGVVLTCFGIYQIGKRINWFRKGLKDPDGSQGSLTVIGCISLVAGIIAILESFQIQVLAELDSKSKNGAVNVPRFILGIVMILVGIFIIINQIKWFKKRLKDPLGYGVRLLIGGFGFIIFGIIMIIKSF